MTGEHDDSDAASHALNALSAEERRAEEQRMRDDQTEREAVEQYRDAAAHLAETVTPVAPPPGLKARLLDMIEEVPQDSPEPERPARLERDDRAPAMEAAESVHPAQLRSRASARATRRWFTRPAPIVAAAAVAAVAVFAGGLFLGTRLPGSSPSPSTSTNQAEVEHLASIAAAEDSQRTEVSAEGMAGTLTWSPSLGLSAVIIRDLPTAPSGKTYQAWYIGDDGPTSAGTFTSQSDSATVHVLSGTYASGDVVGITVEPEGGSTQPTSDPILAFETS